MSSFFKKVGKGLLYLLVFPFLLIILSLCSVFGIIVFIFLGFKTVILFFMGKSIFGDLPEDIQAKKILSMMTQPNPTVMASPYPSSNDQNINFSNQDNTIETRTDSNINRANYFQQDNNQINEENNIDNQEDGGTDNV